LIEGSALKQGDDYMTARRQEAIQMLEKVPEEKLNYVIQIMQGINGLLGENEKLNQSEDELKKFVIATERGQRADEYVRSLRDNDRI
jgi:hypothetical protein